MPWVSTYTLNGLPAITARYLFRNTLIAFLQCASPAMDMVRRAGRRGGRRSSHLSFLRFFDLGLGALALSGMAVSACLSSALSAGASETCSTAGVAASGSAAAFSRLAAYPAGERCQLTCGVCVEKLPV